MKNCLDDIAMKSRIDGEERVGLLIHPVDSRLRGNDGVLVLSCFTLCSRVRHWDRLWSSLVKKGERDCVGCVVLFHPHLSPLPSRERGIPPHRRPSGLRIKSAMTVCRAWLSPPCGFPPTRE